MQWTIVQFFANAPNWVNADKFTTASLGEKFLVLFSQKCVEHCALKINANHLVWWPIRIRTKFAQLRCCTHCNDHSVYLFDDWEGFADVLSLITPTCWWHVYFSYKVIHLIRRDFNVRVTYALQKGCLLSNVVSAFIFYTLLHGTWSP